VAPAPLPRALRAGIDWAWATREYAEQRTVVIDECIAHVCERQAPELGKGIIGRDPTG
jgi:hypothetical protein